MSSISDDSETSSVLRRVRERIELPNVSSVPWFLQRHDIEDNAISKDLTLHPAGNHDHGGDYDESDDGDDQRGGAARPRLLSDIAVRQENNRARSRSRPRSWVRSRPRARSWVRTSTRSRFPDRRTEATYVDIDHHPSNRGEARDGGKPAPQLQPTLRINPFSPQDVTLHMSVPLQDDLEDLLEECCRLRRLGHFTEAIALFQGQLSHFLDNRYVLVQYAQCLFEAGLHDQLDELAEEKAPHGLGGVTNALQLNWKMLLFAALKGPYKRHKFTLRATQESMLREIKAVIRGAWPRLDSTECQVLALMPHIGLPLVAVVPLYRMESLYRHLVEEEMVWEVRDIVQGLLLFSPPAEVVASISLIMQPEARTSSNLPPHKSLEQHRLSQLRELWSESAEDEPTLFALLDTFTTLALHCREEALDSDYLSHRIQYMRGFMSDCMNAADECASNLLVLDGGYLMTRPCLKWMTNDKKDDNTVHLRDQFSISPTSKDGFLLSRHVFPSDRLPLYDVSYGMVPQWKPGQVSPEDDFESMAQLVIRAAEELGDLELQTGCLKQLMYRGVQPPERILPKLRSIWSSAGNDSMLSSLNLFRALLAHSPSERDELRRDLLLKGGTVSEIFLSLRFHLIAALSLDTVQQEAFQDLAESICPKVRGASHYEDVTTAAFGNPPKASTLQDYTSSSSVLSPVRRSMPPRRPSMPPRRPPMPFPRRAMPPPPPSSALPPLGPPSPPVVSPSRQLLSLYETEIKDIERQICSTGKYKNKRELRALITKLKQLERSRLNAERDWERRNAPETRSTRDASAELENGDEHGPLPKMLQRRATVEDYLGGSDVSKSSDRRSGITQPNVGENKGKYNRSQPTYL
ncbi:hypothetical protein C7999DRAFT_17957 [Corynascus novoguineensis]|uniref:Uncharacterized protein n=1 Tax=Corynascus novoguineensis TaxID=1126955 RepID=A0AAN7CKH1_9PEZI|nr:hypothetical protein C7999DRAFT_17957 [Corynascus novoguineensis]